jgi:hypothetical protein
MTTTCIARVAIASIAGVRQPGPMIRLGLDAIQIMTLRHRTVFPNTMSARSPGTARLKSPVQKGPENDDQAIPSDGETTQAIGA